MKLRLIRNATMVLDYGGQHILLDPYFAPRHSLESFTGKSPNPLVELPLTPDQIVDGINWVIVSHLHTDHFDAVAQVHIPKSLPLFCQPGDEQEIRDTGFTEVTTIEDSLTHKGITLTRTDGHHGLGEVGDMMGKVSGFVFQAKGEPAIYWAGDTVLCDEVRDAIAKFKPDVVITHSSGAVWPNSTGERELIVMDDAQTVEVCLLAPTAKVIAVHMESLDHGTTSRADIRTRARESGISDSALLIPADGETVEIG
jgi:L-ascorbate metabolism protein UlaG (beta-lactamase superfamily)